MTGWVSVDCQIGRQKNLSSRSRFGDFLPSNPQASLTQDSLPFVQNHAKAQGRHIWLTEAFVHGPFETTSAFPGYWLSRNRLVNTVVVFLWTILKAQYIAIMPDLTVRPLPRGTPAASPNIFTVYLAEAYLERHGLQLGSVCAMRTANGPIGSVIVRKSPDLSIKVSVIQTSQALQSIYGLKLGDKVALRYIKSSLQSALVVSVAEVRAEANGSSRASECSEETHAWRSSLRAMLREAEVFSPGLKLHDVAASGCRKTYEVLDIDGEREIQLFRIDADFEIRILESIESLVPHVERVLSIPRDGIGMSWQVLQYVVFLVFFLAPFQSLSPRERRTFHLKTHNLTHQVRRRTRCSFGQGRSARGGARCTSEGIRLVQSDTQAAARHSTIRCVRGR